MINFEVDLKQKVSGFYLRVPISSTNYLWVAWLFWHQALRPAFFDFDVLQKTSYGTFTKLDRI